MRFRTFAWTAAAITVVGINTGILLWLREGRSGGARGGGAGAEYRPHRVPETPIPLRPGDPEVTEPAERPRLRVTVADERGSPVPGASVRVLGDRPGGWSPFPEEILGAGTTAPDGTAEFSLPRRCSLVVRATAAGFAGAEVRAAAEEAAIVLAREAVLRVRVVDDATGALLAGVPIRLHERLPPDRVVLGAREQSGLSGADGVHAFRGLPAGTWTVAAESADRPMAWAGAETSTGAETAVEVRLKTGFSVRGRVVVPGFDQRVAEGSVCVGPHYLPRRFTMPTARSVPLDADGRFVLDGLAEMPKSALLLRVETGGRIHAARGQRPVVDPETGEQVGEILVPIPGNNPDSSFSGTVTDEAGRPVEGALVLLGARIPSNAVLWMRSDLRLDEAWTSGDGTWRVVPEHSGGRAAQVLVLHPGYAPALVEVPTRMRRRVVDAVLRKGASVVVTVRDAAGRPAAGAQVGTRIRSPDPESAWEDFGDVHGAIRAHPRTDPGGLAVLGHLGEGSWYLAVRSADGCEGAHVLLEVPPGAAGLAVDVSLAPLPVVRGTVRLRDGIGEIPQGACLLVPGETPSDFLRIPIEASGRFESPPLLIPPSLLVDGRVPVFDPDLTGRGRLMTLAEPGTETEIVVDPPAPPQAR